MLRTAPLGLRMTKQTLNSVLKIDDLNVVIDLEERAQAICGRGPDFEEAMQAFLEKRPPRYATSSPSGKDFGNLRMPQPRLELDHLDQVPLGS